uniref:Uncharacterized protein n=1 Tax=Oryza nivara TaxID=4536 RepID=A0A0E0JCJ7_ORYNI
MYGLDTHGQNPTCTSSLHQHQLRSSDLAASPASRQDIKPTLHQLLFCHLCKNKKSLGVAAVVQGIDVIHAVAIRLGDSAALVLQFVDQGAAEYAVEHTLHKMRGRHRGGRLKMKLDVKKMDFDERTMWKMDFDDRVSIT